MGKEEQFGLEDWVMISRDRVVPRLDRTIPDIKYSQPLAVDYAGHVEWEETNIHVR